MTTPGENLSPTVDFVFRKLFGSEENTDLLISLINSIVEPSLHLTEVLIKNPFNLADYDGSKESILDFKAKSQDGTWYDIEMQVNGHVLYGKRAIYYAAKVYTDQLESAEQFSTLNTTIGIHLLGFNLFADDRVVRQFVFKDMETNEHPETFKFLQLYFVEIGKFHKDLLEISTPRDRWVAFMTQGAWLHHDNLPKVMEADPLIVKAVSALERMGADPELRRIYEIEEAKRMGRVEELQYAREEGIQLGFERGIQKGVERGIQQGVERGLQRGIEQGIQRGIEQGHREFLSRLLFSHYGEVPATVAARLDSLSATQLDELGAALLHIKSYAEVEAWLERL